MKEFLLIFRSDFVANQTPPSPEQLQNMMNPWQDWMGSNIIVNGPYVEIKEAIGGYIIIKADSLDEAAELSKGCPILSMNGNVEVRTIVPMDDNS